MPVGHIIESTNADFNPNTLYIGTTWVKIEGRFMLGSSSSYSLGNTGGSADAVVVEHAHSISITSYEASGYGLTKTGSFTNRVCVNSGTNTLTSGESRTGKNMPPYKVVNIWERTA